MKTEFLTSSLEPAYEKFLKTGDHTLFYHSNGFRKFLRRFPGLEDHYLVALNGGEIVGVLPAFICHGESGKCLNSLPFFGSNGGVVEMNGDQGIRDSLVKSFFELGAEKNCLSATMITNPFDQPAKINHHYDYTDERIGQITNIRNFRNNDDDIYNFGSFTRRMIRKAIKNSVTAERSNGPAFFEFLKETHFANMEDIDGKKKPADFFSLAEEHFKEGEEYDLWVGFRDGKPIAALLLFYFNRTVEYYIPAIVKEYKSIQPLSLLIFEAMKHASDKGYHYWNWGGTHFDQEGVHTFKKQWNAQNIPYQYYIRVYDEKLLTYSQNKVEQEFPYCYLVPFNELKA
jgi:hypothetical protein